MHVVRMFPMYVMCIFLTDFKPQSLFLEYLVSRSESPVCASALLSSTSTILSYTRTLLSYTSTPYSTLLYIYIYMYIYIYVYIYTRFIYIYIYIYIYTLLLYSPTLVPFSPILVPYSPTRLLYSPKLSVPNARLLMRARVCVCVYARV